MLPVFLAISILLFSGVSNANENYDHKARATNNPQKQEQLPNLPAFGTIGFPITVRETIQNETLWNSKECPRAKSHDEADLCEQRRMSEAADKSVLMNIIQVVLGFLGFMALLITIQLTRVSTKAAVDAAKAATSAWEEQRRPYVFISGVATLGCKRSPYSQGEFLGVVTYSVKNHGAVPAIIEEARAQFMVKNRGEIIPIPDVVCERNPLFIDPILSPDECRSAIKETTLNSLIISEHEDGLPNDSIRVSISDSSRRGFIDVDPIIKDGCRLVFRVVITYRGPFTSSHETSACWVYDPSLQRFDKTGPQENYER